MSDALAAQCERHRHRRLRALMITDGEKNVREMKCSEFGEEIVKQFGDR